MSLRHGDRKSGVRGTETGKLARLKTAPLGWRLAPSGSNAPASETELDAEPEVPATAGSLPREQIEFWRLRFLDQGAP